MRCGDDNELTAYVEGLLDGDRARDVAVHVDACPACRRVLAGLVSGRAERASSPPLRAAPVPSNLIGQYLKNDAPAREMMLSRFWACVSLGGVTSLGAVGFWIGVRGARTGAAILVVLFLYESTVYALLHRGWYRPFLPLASTLAENAVFFAMNATLMGLAPAGIVTSPGALAWIALVMFTAIRGSEWLCMTAATIAAAGFALPFVLYADRLTASASGPVAPLVAVGTGFFLVAGVAGATLARYLENRAAAALQEIREHDLFGKYILHEALGAGGMGQVFRATYMPEGGFTRTVAVKRLRADLSTVPRFREALRAEAYLSSRLVHPNLVQVLDCGTFRGNFVLVMEYVDGTSLRRLLEHGPLPLVAAVYVGAELAAALEYIHARRGSEGAPLGLVHCDVNPPNVLISRIGEVKLCDFGVARLGTPAVGWETFGGKRDYAAPEQLSGGTVDPRTDLYALGLTLFELLAGRRPFERDGSPANREAPSLLDVRPEAPPELAALVDQLVSFDRARRPSDARVVRQVLTQIQARLSSQPGDQVMEGIIKGALAAAPG